MSLDEFHGLYDHMPMLAALFLMTGLASIGFPGTIGFVGTELLIEGAVVVYPLTGMAVVVAAALNGIAILHAYFRIFTGTTHTASISLSARPAERVTVLILTALILGGGLFPQPGVASRYHAAAALIRLRGGDVAPAVDDDHLLHTAGRQATINAPHPRASVPQVSTQENASITSQRQQLTRREHAW